MPLTSVMSNDRANNFRCFLKTGKVFILQNLTKNYGGLQRLFYYNTGRFMFQIVKGLYQKKKRRRFSAASRNRIISNLV